MNIVQMSVQAGLLIIAIVLVRAVALYRLPKTSFLALWGIVTARMLIPFSLESKWSVYNILNRLHPQTDVGNTLVDTLIYEYAPMLPGNAGEPSEVLSTFSAFEVVWIGGIAVLFAVFAILLIRNYWTLRTAEPVTNNEYITQWRTKHHLRRPLEVVRSAQVASPASLGILRPRIILPQAMDVDSGEKLQYILAHEYFHICRFDMLWKLLVLCAVCVHWFNPLAWVMLFLLNRDLELSCDEMVLRHFGKTDRTAYALSLIDMAERSPAFNIMHSYFSKHAVEERIIAIMKYKKSSLLAVVAALALVVCVTTAFATNPPNQVQEHESVAGTLVSVNLGDEDKFTPEQWAEILEKVEAGEVMLFDTLEDEIAYFDSQENDNTEKVYVDHIDLDGENIIREELGRLLAVRPEDESKFTPEEWAEILEKVERGEIYWQDEEPDANAVADCGYPIYITDDSNFNVEKALVTMGHNKLGNEENAYSYLAAGAETPVGTLTAAEGQTVTVSVACNARSEFEVGIKKVRASVVASEKLVVNEADGTASAALSVNESGEYVLYVKNIGGVSDTAFCTFSIGYTIT